MIHEVPIEAAQLIHGRIAHGAACLVVPAGVQAVRQGDGRRRVDAEVVIAGFFGVAQGTTDGELGDS